MKRRLIQDFEASEGFEEEAEYILVETPINCQESAMN